MGEYRIRKADQAGSTPAVGSIGVVFSMPRAVTRDGKRRRGSTPTRLIDSDGREQAVPDLDELALTFELSGFRRLEFKLTYKDCPYAFSNQRVLGKYQRKAVVRDAAVHFCRTFLNIRGSNHKLTSSDEFKTVWRKWKPQLSRWNKHFDEADQLLAVQEIMTE